MGPCSLEGNELENQATMKPMRKRFKSLDSYSSQKKIRFFLFTVKKSAENDCFIKNWIFYSV